MCSIQGKNLSTRPASTFRSPRSGIDDASTSISESGLQRGWTPRLKKLVIVTAHPSIHGLARASAGRQDHQEQAAAADGGDSFHCSCQYMTGLQSSVRLPRFARKSRRSRQQAAPLARAPGGASPDVFRPFCASAKRCNAT